MRGGYRVNVVNGADLSDDDIAAGNELQNVVNQEIFPDDPPNPAEVAIARHRAMPPRIRRRSVRATAPDGTLVGLTGLRIDPEHDENPDLLTTFVMVHPAHRRRGVGTALLAELVTVAKAEGRTRLLAEATDAVAAGPAFATAVGGDMKSQLHLNHLPTAEVDRALMEAWVKEGPIRAEGYELIHWDGPTPPEHLAGFADIIMVMNTAPRDDIEMNDFVVTPEMVREQERVLFEGGDEVWTIVARRTGDDSFAALHNVAWSPNEPETVWVHMTGVQPEHRGHALGKWLKAAMTLRVLDERPRVTDIRTGNADSNAAMLGINRAMGYRPMVGASMWEVRVEQVEQYLASRGGQ